MHINSVFSSKPCNSEQHWMISTHTVHGYSVICLQCFSLSGLLLECWHPSPNDSVMSNATFWLDQSIFMADDSRAIDNSYSRTALICGIRQPSDSDLQTSKKTPTSHTQIFFIRWIRGVRQEEEKNNFVAVCYPASVSGFKPGTRWWVSRSLQIAQAYPADGLTQSGPF